jgi:hypothetical protein
MTAGRRRGAYGTFHGAVPPPPGSEAARHRAPDGTMRKGPGPPEPGSEYVPGVIPGRPDRDGDGEEDDPDGWVDPWDRRFEGKKGAGKKDGGKGAKRRRKKREGKAKAGRTGRAGGGAR